MDLSFIKLLLLEPEGFPRGTVVNHLPADVGDARDVFNSWVGRSFIVGDGNLPVFLPGKIPWPKEPGGLSSIGSQGSDVTERRSTH